MSPWEVGPTIVPLSFPPFLSSELTNGLGFVGVVYHLLFVEDYGTNNVLFGEVTLSSFFFSLGQRRIKLTATVCRRNLNDSVDYPSVER